MLKGEWYNARDDQLMEMYKKTRKLLQKFNGELSENPNRFQIIRLQ
ncbi:maltose acetyltransferase domain-containing protein [Clostridium gasigenes]|nr:maltose acetyltransferase domain-containing protein [Clostridium gasigenes]MBU3107834.1 hypothetical protein [Clostridium gasigenes]